MGKFKDYVTSTRPHVLTATFAPVFIGSTYALFYVEKFSFLKFFIYLIACLLIQISTNYFNEYYDFKRGLDNTGSQGSGGSLVHGKLKPEELLRAALISYGIAILLGIYLSSLTTYYLFLLGLVCMFAGYSYTGGKYPIAYSPYGELASGFFMGTLMTALAFFIQTGFVNFSVIFLSLPMFLMIGNTLMSNSIRDAENDKECGRKTLAILLGKKRSVELLALSFFLVYLINFIFAFTQHGSNFNFLVFAVVPLSIKIIKGYAKNRTKETMHPFMVLTAKKIGFIGYIMALANILSYYI